MVTTVPTEFLKAYNAENGDSLKAEKGGVKAQATEISAVAEMVDADYDSSVGVLTIEFFNGQILRVGNFPNLNSIPQGEQGLKGEKGEDGEDGRDGKDGEKGDKGCQGEQGEKGETGDDGRDGRDGANGSQGERGCAGPKGKQGEKGEKGERGDAGEKGERGDVGPQGIPGPVGPSGKVNIIVSVSDPGASAGAGTIWVNPSITEASAAWP